MHLFYFETSSLLNHFNSGNHLVSLTGDEANHLKVMRLRSGDKLLLTDGIGNLSKAEIIDSSSKSNTIRLLDVKTSGQPSHKLHIAIAPPKNIARFEWFLEKATEIGIDEITPFISEHSERATLRNDRLNKVLISAMKQSLKTYLPKLNPPSSLTGFIEEQPVYSQKFIAWLDKETEQQHLKVVCKANEPVTVLIGPEGDFSAPEVLLAKAKGFIPVSLGKSRLRTETAALAACLIVNVLNEPDYVPYPLNTDEG